MVAPNNPTPSASDTSSPKRPVSRRKRRANRRNAQKSTGPRTPEGKAVAARNAVSHGVFCADLVLPGEDGQKLAFIRNGLLDATRPQDLLELALVDRMVSAQWRVERCQRAEADAYKLLVQRDRAQVEKRMARLRRRHEFRDLAELEEFCRDHDDQDLDDQKLLEALEEYRVLSQAGRVTPPPSLTLAMSAMMFDVPSDHPGVSSRALERLAQYEQRLHNQFHRALRELERLRQLCRKWEELPPSPFAAPLSQELDALVQHHQSGEADLQELLNAASAMGRAALAAEGKLASELLAELERQTQQDESPEDDSPEDDSEDSDSEDSDSPEEESPEEESPEQESQSASAPAAPAPKSAARKNEPTAPETATGGAPAGSCDQPPRPPHEQPPADKPPTPS